MNYLPLSWLTIEYQTNDKQAVVLLLANSYTLELWLVHFCTWRIIRLRDVSKARSCRVLLNSSRVRGRGCCGAVLRRFSRLAGVAACCLRRGSGSYSCIICYSCGVQRFSWLADDSRWGLLDMVWSVCCIRRNRNGHSISLVTHGRRKSLQQKYMQLEMRAKLPSANIAAWGGIEVVTAYH